ncbi:facilitated trehalose transporter Tret1 [Dendroctonus ponderosae]|uniref:Major facilitator superfamily (MFS) profile domain-containing protein n=1 Tax=Dendroctonus ponderosae TaxID=77166 RepID=U4USM7_DENPD|nr:facilitated trehalose transporter Tret1 [Dendroctonus ponderosae]ERL95523.1 hypothetical protein D910_12785 [Dendroctonus ponderosae]KAH1026947.1 hypothetical protein HUJ05_000536 [Dendroctonus ponderosae]
MPAAEWPQILTIIIACIPGLTSSLIFTWSSVYIPILPLQYNISENDANYLPIVSSLGCSIPALFFYKLPCWIGPKGALLLLSIPQAAYWIITIFARDIVWLCVARFVGGAADAIMYAVLPMYLGEVTTPKIRGTWGNGQTFSFNAGFFVMSATGSFLTIQTTACVFLSLPVLFTALFMWMPESPYYFIAKGRDAKARSSLQFLLRKKNVNEEFQSLKKDVDRQVSETGTWRDLWMIRSNRRALIACVFLRWAQQLAGIAVFETYFQFIFQKAGPTALTPQGSALVFSGALWLAMTGFSFTLDKLGRRKSFVFSALGCALCLTAESCYFFIDEFRPGLDLASFSWFPIAGLLLYIFFYAFGLGILPSLMAGELFSASIKAKGLAVANVFMGVICFFTATIFKTLSNELGLYAPFALFALCTFGSCALSLSIVPETRGRTLEEIQQDLKGARKF